MSIGQARSPSLSQLGEALSLICIALFGIFFTLARQQHFIPQADGVAIALAVGTCELGVWLFFARDTFVGQCLAISAGCVFFNVFIPSF